MLPVIMSYVYFSNIIDLCDVRQFRRNYHLTYSGPTIHVLVYNVIMCSVSLHATSEYQLHVFYEDLNLCSCSENLS